MNTETIKAIKYATKQISIILMVSCAISGLICIFWFLSATPAKDPTEPVYTASANITSFCQDENGRYYFVLDENSITTTGEKTDHSEFLLSKMKEENKTYLNYIGVNNISLSNDGSNTIIFNQYGSIYHYKTKVSVIVSKDLYDQINKFTDKTIWTAGTAASYQQ